MIFVTMINATDIKNNKKVEKDLNQIKCYYYYKKIILVTNILKNANLITRFNIVSLHFNNYNFYKS